MAVDVVESVVEYLEAVQDPKNRLGLVSLPATPWYLGNPDLKGTLLPGLYQPSAKIKAEYEREALRDFRLSSAEFASTRNLTDADILFAAQIAGLPTRIIEWSSNPLFALFMAVENLSTAENARVWVLNPWRMNELTVDLSYVPPTDDEDLFDPYVVALDDPDESPFPEAKEPMAVRPVRSARIYNAQSVFWTVHGREKEPLEDLKFFMKRADEFVTMIHIAKDKKKRIMRELHDMNATRATFFPTLTNLSKTLAYRYSSNYITD